MGKITELKLAGQRVFKQIMNKYLDEFNTMDFYPKWWLVYVKYDPLFDKIRNE